MVTKMRIKNGVSQRDTKRFGHRLWVLANQEELCDVTVCDVTAYSH